MQGQKIIRIFSILIALSAIKQVDAQTCIADYFSTNYKGETAQTINNNRWGQLIFETNDINKRWDGKYKKLLQPLGIYIYYVEMEDLKGKRITKKGSVTLIR